MFIGMAGVFDLAVCRPSLSYLVVAQTMDAQIKERRANAARANRKNCAHIKAALIALLLTLNRQLDKYLSGEISRRINGSIVGLCEFLLELCACLCACVSVCVPVQSVL